MKTTTRIPALPIRLLGAGLLLGVLAVATVGIWRSAAAADVALHVDVAPLAGGECLDLDPECRPAPARCEHAARCAIIAPASERPSAPPLAPIIAQRSAYQITAPRAWVQDPRATRGDRYLLTRRLRI